MKKVFIASGTNPLNNKRMIKAFNNQSESDKFMIGLTELHIHVIGYKSTIELVNHLLKG